ncbi:MAG: cytochrome c biogenesis protein ResB [Anaerolineae bacterium]|nr:cytochrome c biogenesis protein ResB [Thermoflexales bacterium]MDW8408686.1 cytochrome c biogenesis protein ResB [Anaerolineae bacterium]
MMTSSPSQPPSAAIDALEQRDIWRSAWQVLTGDPFTILLCATLIVIGGVALIVPQAPTAGVADPVAYSRWQAEAQVRLGAAYPLAQELGLFGLAQAFWVRALIWVCIAVLLARLVDRVVRLMIPARSPDLLLDETRLRVSDQAPPMHRLADILRSKGYRVLVSAEYSQTQQSSAVQTQLNWIRADRRPWAEMMSIVLHIGLLMALAGIVTNSWLGWSASRQSVNTDTPLALPGWAAQPLTLLGVDRAADQAIVRFEPIGEPVTLTIGAPVRAPAMPGNPASCCLQLTLTELTVAYRVTAHTVGGAPLTITLSSYADPVTDALLTFRPGETDRSFALSTTNLGVILSSRGNQDRARVFTFPDGRVLTDTAIYPTLVISDVVVRFDAQDGALIEVHYQPGALLLGAGGALALVGLIGVWVYPMHSVLIRRHDRWTEFYAAGRRTRSLVRLLSAQ